MIEREIADKLQRTPARVRWVRERSAVGRACAAGLAARYGLDPGQPLGQQLAARGILTMDAGAWLDGAPQG
jgi:hypothetical protein